MLPVLQEQLRVLGVALELAVPPATAALMRSRQRSSAGDVASLAAQQSGGLEAQEAAAAAGLPEVRACRVAGHKGQVLPWCMPSSSWRTLLYGVPSPPLSVQCSAVLLPPLLPAGLGGAAARGPPAVHRPRQQDHPVGAAGQRRHQRQQHAQQRTRQAPRLSRPELSHVAVSFRHAGPPAAALWAGFRHPCCRRARPALHTHAQPRAPLQPAPRRRLLCSRRGRLWRRQRARRRLLQPQPQQQRQQPDVCGACGQRARHVPALLPAQHGLRGAQQPPPQRAAAGWGQAWWREGMVGQPRRGVRLQSMQG